MNELGKKLARIAFDERGADYLLAMREEHGNVAPSMIRKGEDAGDVRVDLPYQLVNILSNIYPWVPKGRIAVVCRRCDEKALNEIIKRNLMDRDRLILIGLACTREQVALCRCSDPVPSKVDIGEANAPVREDPLMVKLDSMSQQDRLKFWTSEFRKCNKCFGCTLNCPVCFCDDCVLEEHTFTPELGIPPSFAFHLVRSMHMSDKCIECGECERSCAGGIPLLTLRKMANRDMKRMFGYEAGDKEKVSPLLTTLEGKLLEDGEHVC